MVKNKILPPAAPETPMSEIVVRCRRTRKQVRADRLWRHWLSWMGEPHGPDLKRIEGYQSEKYRSAFEQFQTHGRKGLSEDELYGIHPLLSAQKAKEVTLTSMAEESMEWWAKGNGWGIPWADTLERVKSGEKMDRLTRVAILRTVKSIAKDPHDFFERHPGISAELKQRYFSYRVATLNAESSRLASLRSHNEIGEATAPQKPESKH